MLKYALVLGLVAVLFGAIPVHGQEEPRVRLGNEVLLDDHRDDLQGKRVGLITNHTGVNSRGQHMAKVLAEDDHIHLTALYTPEHGLDGEKPAGEYVESYTHEELGIPVYSLYGPTRKPTSEMLDDVDILLFDIQDIGARTYTYISTLNYCMVAGAQHDVPVWVLDRPNPLGGIHVDGPVLEEPFVSFVGVDEMPKAHGMTVGEIALFFNRKVGVDLRVIEMQGYTRNMIFFDTGLPWVQTSPNIPDLKSCFGYMATGLGQGTGVFQADKFTWIGGEGLDSHTFARQLSDADLPGVQFEPEAKNAAGGVRLRITDYHDFNPALTGIYALAHAFLLGDFTAPQSDNDITMFDKIMGTDRFSQWLNRRMHPQEMERRYTSELEKFRQKRRDYLIDAYDEEILIRVHDSPIDFDAAPIIDPSDRVLVPARAIAEALGGDVQWDASDYRVTITHDDSTVEFIIGDSFATVNGERRQMDTHPIIRQDRTLIPVRYIGEFLGADVEWKDEWRIVNVY